MKNQFDVIVIGSGMGGMTAGSLLTQFYGKRVLIVERHFKFGGLTHEFKRKGATFSPGIHYIGGMDEGETTRKVFDVTTGFKVTLNKMPDDFDTFSYPNFSMKASSEKAKYIAELKKYFPTEADGIDKYFKDIFLYNKLFGMGVAKNAVPKIIRAFIGFGETVYSLFLHKRINKNWTLQKYLDSTFKDEKLKAVLASQWGDYGVLPSQGAMLMHAVIATHYIKGAWFPAEGSTSIGNAVKQIIEGNGGKIIIANAVKEIIIEKSKAIGVRLEKADDNGSDVYFGKHIISNIGADLTYNKLLPASGFSAQNIQRKITNLISKENFVSAFIILKKSPKELGFNGGNHWWYRHYNHNENICSVADNQFPSSLYISFHSLKVNQDDKHTLDVMTTIPYSDVAKWQNEKWMKRGEDYNNLKQEIADKIIKQLNINYPNIKDEIEYIEVATPLTTQNFTARTTGSSYGLAATPERFQQSWLSVYTPIKNLYLSGQDISSAGIVGAMMGGVCAAGAVVGATGFIKVMGKVLKASKAQS